MRSRVACQAFFFSLVLVVLVFIHTGKAVWAWSSHAVTPSLMQKAQKAVASGTISRAQLESLKRKYERGGLTPAEIEEGRRLLEARDAGGNATEEKGGAQVAGKGDETAEGEGEEQRGAPRKGLEVLPPDMASLLAKRPEDRPLPKLRYFGYDLFSKSPSTFAPVPDVPVPGDYLLGPGDELVVFLWGRLDETFHLVVDREGIVNVPHLGPVPVLGLGFDDVRTILKQKLEAITGVNARVSMGRLRSIRVFVLGEVKRPGLYTVSALSTLTNALLASGGPTRLGTLRQVELKRDGRVVSRVDFYRVLLQGDTSGDVKLQPGDVIFVPKAGPRVAVYGNVRRPAVYELADQRGLGTLFDLAGGIRPTAYVQRIQVERSHRHEKKIVLDLREKDWAAYRDFQLEDGDAVRVFSIMPSSVNAVYLMGNVVRPGKYAWQSGMRLSELVPDEGALLPHTALDYGLIKRYHQDTMTTELIPFRPAGLLKGNREDDLLLAPLDEVYIFNRWYFEDPPEVTVEGEVRMPGTYRVDDRTRLKDVIHLAGGLTRDAYLQLAHVYRIDPETNRRQVFFVDLGRALKGDEHENILLMPRDRVMVHSIHEMTPVRNVSISGEVNRPGTYPYADNMTLRDLILIAGNVKETAYLEQGEIVRFVVTEGSRVKAELVTFDVRDVLNRGSAAGIRLYPYDTVFIKRIPEWRETWRVSVWGEVRFPGNYTITRGERLSQLMERCGGFTSDAYPRGIVFTRQSVRRLQEERLRELTQRMQAEIARLSSMEMQTALSREEAENAKNLISSLNTLVEKLSQARPDGRIVLKIRDVRSLEGTPQDMVLENGDSLLVPRTPQTVLVLGQVYNPNAMLFDPEHPEAGHYISLAGGLTSRADKKEIYIVRADGTVESTKAGKFLAWNRENFRFTFGQGIGGVKLMPGDTIIVPERLKFPNYMKNLKDITEMLYHIAISVGVWKNI